MGGGGGPNPGVSNPGTGGGVQQIQGETSSLGSTAAYAIDLITA